MQCCHRCARVWQQLWPWKAGLAEPSHEGMGCGGDVAALNMPANLENSAVATGLEKCQFSFQSQRKALPKNVQTTTQLHSSHTLAK